MRIDLGLQRLKLGFLNGQLFGVIFVDQLVNLLDHDPEGPVQLSDLILVQVVARRQISNTLRREISLLHLLHSADELLDGACYPLGHPEGHQNDHEHAGGKNRDQQILHP
ncbi:hypothetical protein D3C75_1208200 [compost metagenome]